MKKTIIAAAIGSMGLLHTGFALSAGEQERAAAEGKMETVTVTAGKRGAEALQNVPISISVFNADQMEQRAITSFMDYGTSVPNLGFGETGDGTLASRSISIRGVGGDNTTGFYIDDTPVPGSMDPHIVDIERIEILRGPQGTLYGARSMGGAVRLITQKPNYRETSGFANLSTSKTSGAPQANSRVEVGVNTPLIADTLALRADLFRDDEAGFFKRTFPTVPHGAQLATVDNVGAVKKTGGSESLSWKVNRDLTITQRYMSQHTDEEGFPFADFFTNSAGSVPLKVSNFVQARTFNVPEGGTDKWSLSSLDLKYKTGFGEFVVSSSYFNRRTYEWEDQTALLNALLPVESAASPLWRLLENKRYAHEFRFASAFSGPTQFIAGLFLSDETNHRAFPPSYSPGINAAMGGHLGTDEVNASEAQTHNKERAIFGEVSHQFNDKLSLTGGLRTFHVDYSADPSWTEGFAGPGPRANVPASSASESGVNPKLLVQYKLTPDLMTYATAAKGYRPGGTAPGIPAGNVTGCDTAMKANGLTLEQTRKYASDSLWSYELGAKSSWLNVAVYDIEWKDMQQPVGVCGFHFMSNVGAAQIRGMEIEAHGRLMAGLNVAAGIGYADAKISEGGGLSPQKPGDHISQVPALTGNVSGTYTRRVGDDLYSETTVSYAYVGNSYSTTVDASSPRERPAYGLLNAQTSLSWSKYRISLFGKNLGNTHANLGDNVSIAMETPGRLRLATNQPRTIGVNLSAKF